MVRHSSSLEDKQTISCDSTRMILVDAGVDSLKVRAIDHDGNSCGEWQWSSKFGFAAEFFPISYKNSHGVLITGKLASLARDYWPSGRRIPTAAALWAFLESRQDNNELAVIELSASGYHLVGLDKDGELKNGLLVTPPRCGSGPGINIDRVLQKLALERGEVDTVLAQYLGDEGKTKRQALPTRADRCGVFATSATVSDKNQGIPVEFALATTLKSEVLKTCHHLMTDFDEVWLTGGLFRWAFCRDVARDYLLECGVGRIVYDQHHTAVFEGLYHLGRSSGGGGLASSPQLHKEPSGLPEYPALVTLGNEMRRANRFQRLPATPVSQSFSGNQELLIAIDAGSTMAKVVASDGTGETLYHLASYTNSGDTLETVRQIFRELRHQCQDSLNILGIGLTGSARYQLQQALSATYPQLVDRLTLLVENYAHARGSVELARDHIRQLQGLGISNLEKEQCLLVDIGGEDTKISTIDLERGELLDNAMNTKCSAGTGSLLDTLMVLFQISDINQATQMALHAKRGYMLNATCAVFLLEHARRLQAQGVAIDEILASAVWAIVENMARSLWKQLELPVNGVVLLHGQTMLSDPLPIAVAERMSGTTHSPCYSLVPPHPGHRACMGLLKTMASAPMLPAVPVELSRFIQKTFTKKVTTCRGGVCGDSRARCNRSLLTGRDTYGEQVRITLGGCSAIQERSGTIKNQPVVTSDVYREVHKFICSRLPVSKDPHRLVIPRSFAVSEWAGFFVGLFAPLGIAVHVDSVVEEDILRGQPHFQIDTCAPHIGAVGQMLRLAEEPHGVILAPQLEFLPSQGTALGRTCTINQGGPAVAHGVARSVFPKAHIHLFHMEIRVIDAEIIAQKIYPRLLSIYEFYNVKQSFNEFCDLVQAALHQALALKKEAADYAVSLAEKALAAGSRMAIVMGREYILNPGVYDSHIGRLLREKGLFGIPGYLLDVQCDNDFSHLYWRNAHQSATLAAAAARNEIHTVVAHEGLRQLLEEIEEQQGQLVPLVQVSTFLCGPDSVTNILIDQVIKKRPFLRIQSDAAIKELAHLENRVNTYVKQLAENGQYQGTDATGEFKVEMLSQWVHGEPLDPEGDVLAFPTLGDNRVLVSLLRGAGFDCLDTYDDTYQLVESIARGRAVAGDSVCAPLAAVYGDVLFAINRFKALRRNNRDWRNKKRLLIFNNKSLGPCRQGQYVETHKLFFHQSQNASDDQVMEELAVRFLVGRENEGFRSSLPQWLYFRGIQCGIIHGILQQLLADGVSRCRTEDEVKLFLDEYGKLKTRLNSIILQLKPSDSVMGWLQRYDKIKPLSPLVQFIAYGFHRNPLATELRQFRKAYCKRPLPENPIKIHIDGEAYMRVAQFEEIHRHLIELLGVGTAQISITPVWCYLEYKLASMMMRSKESIVETRAECKRVRTDEHKEALLKFLRKKQKQRLGGAAAHFGMRQILAAPLYRAAGLAMPDSVVEVLEVAKEVVSTRRPGGELMPFIGEAVLKLRDGYDLVLNVAPEGCMVSSMAEVIVPAIARACPDAKGKVLPLFSQQGDVDKEQLETLLLKTLGPNRVTGLR